MKDAGFAGVTVNKVLVVGLTVHERGVKLLVSTR